MSEEGRGVSTRLIGRERPLEEIRAAVAQDRPIVVSGAAGVGKTALVKEALREVSPTPVTVRALRLTAHIPLAPFRTINRQHTDPADVRQRLWRRDERGPVVVDNAQWLDGASRSVLAGAPAGCSVISAERPNPRLAHRRTSPHRPHTSQVRIHALTDAEARELLRDRRPDLDRAETDRLVAQAAGNPSILVDLAAGGRARALRLLILRARCRRLSPGARATLTRSLGGEVITQREEPHAVSEIVASGFGAIRGESLEPAMVLREVLKGIPERASTPLRPYGAALTARESAVLVGVADGATNARIAANLEISVSTVESHIRSAMQKLGARNRLHAARLALRGRTNPFSE